MKKQVKVLYVNGGLMDRGGVSAVMMNYYLHIDKNLVHIDFLTHGGTAGVRDNEIYENGGEVFTVTPKSKNYFQNVKQIKKVLKKNNYDIVHAHADSGNAHILRLAKKCGIPVRISHSHNTDHTVNNKLRRKLADLQKKKISKYATHKFACSKEAGLWLYGKEVPVINNAITVRNFAYSKDSRESIRNKYDIGGNLLIGCVGRLDYQKNHKFLLSVFSEIVKKCKDVRLLLVGDGILKNELTEEVKKLGLQEYVIFAGQVSNVNEYYSAFDLFVMPSLFEGLGMVIIEAECSGLPCLLSENIPSSVKINDNVRFLSLDKPDVWVDAILLANIEESQRTTDNLKKVIGAGYDIETQAKKIEQFYMKVSENANESFDNQ